MALENNAQPGAHFLFFFHSPEITPVFKESPAEQLTCLFNRPIINDIGCSTLAQDIFYEEIVTFAFSDGQTISAGCVFKPYIPLQRREDVAQLACRVVQYGQRPVRSYSATGSRE